jgi:hypothetical protein
MYKKILTFFLFTLLIINLLSAQRYTISGVVEDALSGEGLIGANILHIEKGKGATTNFGGNFQLLTDEKKLSIRFTYVGYESQNMTFDLRKDSNIVVKLQPLTLQEVVIKGNVPMHEQTLMGYNSVSIEKIKAIPSFSGEPDLMKAITFLPGVQGGRESSSNLYIRGGNRDQNLILMDETPMYNTNHIGGFLSIFNADAVRKVDIYKGGIPAQYGGRLSSVIDIKLKEGNKKEHRSKFNLGTLICSAMFEGPIQKDKSSYLLAARISYLDLLFVRERLQTRRNGSGSTTSYTIADFNFKANHEFKDKSNLSFHAYTGGDYNAARETYGLNKNYAGKKINNVSLGIGYDKLLLNRYFFHTSLNYANYYGDFFNNSDLQQPQGNDPQQKIDFSSKTLFATLSYKAKLDFDLNAKNHIKIGIDLKNSKYKFGTNSIESFYYPETKIRVSDTNAILSGNQRTFDASLFLEDEILLAQNLRLNAGIRSVYYQYRNTIYPYLEPRFSLRYLMNEKTSFKANIMLSQQENHQIIQKKNGFEREIWVGATEKVLPQRGIQYAIGYFYTLKKLSLEMGIEAYYKTMKNQIEYQQALKSQADFTDWEKSIIPNGKGNTYGAEFFVQRNEGRWNGMMSYTLAWSNRQFDLLNNGKWYPALYDRRHVFNAVGWYDLGKGWSASAQWVFNSGSAFTLPQGLVNTNPYFLGYFAYGSKNNARLPNYHRLDFSIKQEWRNKKKRQCYATFNIYNVYNRKNATFLFVENNQLKQKSEFPILPSMSIGIKI